MPWKECCRVDLRRDAVALAVQPGARRAEIARRFGVSRRTLYKWIDRWREDGDAGLFDQSRRPRSSPRETDESIAAVVVGLRLKHPTWGGRKIRKRLRQLEYEELPAPSTITGILRRHGLIDPAESAARGPFKRFERSDPNELLQMDFKGHFELGNGQRCHPLTILDDHSRFNLAVRALPGERRELVEPELICVFETYGLPSQMLMDHGPPWGAASDGAFTVFTVWLIDLGITVIHGRPRHPQTQGKLERLHRTLKADVIAGRLYRDHEHSQDAFDEWRETYNHERPHEAIGLEVPASRYRMSRRSYTSVIPAWEYPPGTDVRKVDSSGRLSYRGITWRLGKAFVRQSVGVNPTTEDGVFEVKYRHQWVANLDLRSS